MGRAVRDPGRIKTSGRSGAYQVIGQASGLVETPAFYVETREEAIEGMRYFLTHDDDVTHARAFRMIPDGSELIAIGGGSGSHVWVEEVSDEDGA